MGLGTLIARPAAPAVTVPSAPSPSPRTHAHMRTAGATIEEILLDFRTRYGFTPWQAGTYQGFLSIPGAWRASVLLSDLFAQMPFHSFRRDPSGGGAEVATARNALILDAPAASYEDPAVVFASWGMDYLFDGNSVGIYTGRNPTNGLPIAILPVPVSQVGVREVEFQNPYGVLMSRKEYAIGGLVFDQADIFHVKGPCAPGALRGLGVLETQLGALTLARDLERQAAAISLHGVPTGLLKSTNPEADPADLALAKAAWLTSQADRTVAALGPNIDFEPLSWNPEEMQLVEARKFSLTQLELMFGLPVGWLGGETPARTYSNVEQDAVNLIKFSTLAGMILRFESMFSRDCLPRGQTARANRDAVLRSDTMTRYKAHQLALGNKPWKTVDEVRGVENLGPIDGGDVLPTATPAPAVPATQPPGDESGADTDPEGATA